MLHIQRTERLNLPSYWPLVNNMSMAMLKEVVSLKNPFNLCMDKLKIMLSVEVSLDSYQLDMNPLIVLVHSQIWQITFLSQSTAASEFKIPLSLLSFGYQVSVWRRSWPPSLRWMVPWHHATSVATSRVLPSLDIYHRSPKSLLWLTGIHIVLTHRWCCYTAVLTSQQVWRRFTV